MIYIYIYNNKQFNVSLLRIFKMLIIFIFFTCSLFNINIQYLIFKRNNISIYFLYI